jgi:hypothetical protein
MLEIALSAGRTPPSKEPPSGVSDSNTHYYFSAHNFLGEAAAVFTEVRRRGVLGARSGRPKG